MRILEQFRTRLAEMLDDMALSNDEVTNLMQEFCEHPDLRNASFMAKLQKVHSQLPGPIPQRLGLRGCATLRAQPLFLEAHVEGQQLLVVELLTAVTSEMALKPFLPFTGRPAEAADKDRHPGSAAPVAAEARTP